MRRRRPTSFTMQRVSTALRRVRALPVAVALLLSACTSFQRLPTPLPEPLPLNKGDVRLTLKGGRVVQLIDARDQGDSVVGVDMNARRDQPARLAVAKADITEMAVRGKDGWKVFAAATGAVVVILGVLALVAILSIFAHFE